MRRLALSLAGMFSLGITICRILNPPFLPLYLVMLIIFAGSFFVFHKRRVFFILILIQACLSGALLFANYNVVPASHINNLAAAGQNTLCCIEGFVADQPQAKNNRFTFVLETETAQFGNFIYRSNGKVLVFSRDAVSCADKVSVLGHLRPAYDYLRRQNIFFVMQAERLEIKKANYANLRRFSFWLKERMAGIISGYLNACPAAVMQAMVLGDKASIPPLLNDLMIKCGTVHILVVSGFNVGIVAFVVSLFLKILRIPRKIRLGLTVVFLVIYCFLTGASTPVVRATVMAVFFISAYFFKREPDIYNSLGTALIFILALNPRQLFEIGFQLSFVSVLAIVYLYPRMEKITGVAELRPKALKWLINGLLVSFSAWLGTAGIIACYFRIFSPVTVIANIITVPLATIVTLCGFSLVFMSVIFPSFCPFIATTSEAAISILIKTNLILSRIPGAYLSF